MRSVQVFCLLMIAVGCTSCKPDLNSQSYSFTTDSGVRYSYEIIQPQLSPFPARAPFVLVSRSGSKGKNFPLSWTKSRKELMIDGQPLTPPSAPTIYYKKDGMLKSRLITNGGVWTVFFTTNQVTEKEFEQVFEELTRPPVP